MDLHLLDLKVPLEVKDLKEHLDLLDPLELKESLVAKDPPETI